MTLKKFKYINTYLCINTFRYTLKNNKILIKMGNNVNKY